MNRNPLVGQWDFERLCDSRDRASAEPEWLYETCDRYLRRLYPSRVSIYLRGAWIRNNGANWLEEGFGNPNMYLEVHSLVKQRDGMFRPNSERPYDFTEVRDNHPFVPFDRRVYTYEARAQGFDEAPLEILVSLALWKSNGGVRDVGEVVTGATSGLMGNLFGNLSQAGLVLGGVGGALSKTSDKRVGTTRVDFTRVGGNLDHPYHIAFPVCDAAFCVVFDVKVEFDPGDPASVIDDFSGSERLPRPQWKRPMPDGATPAAATKVKPLWTEQGAPATRKDATAAPSHKAANPPLRSTRPRKRGRIKPPG